MKIDLRYHAWMIWKIGKTDGVNEETLWDDCITGLRSAVDPRQWSISAFVLCFLAWGEC